MISRLSFPFIWSDEGDMTSLEAATFGADIVNSYFGKLTDMIGAIIPMLRTDPPNGMLPLDGSTYNASSYPQLYEALPVDWKDEVLQTFTLPDLSGKFLRAHDDDAALFAGDTGGSNTVQLTVNNLPSHSHGNDPHAHSETSVVPTIINGGIEAPANSSVASPSTTGLSSINIHSTGGDEPFSIIPPFFAVKFYIVAKWGCD